MSRPNLENDRVKMFLLGLLVARGPSYAYALWKQLGEDHPISTVYSALGRLKDLGYVTATQITVNGRVRRVYDLTPGVIAAVTETGGFPRGRPSNHFDGAASEVSGVVQS